jgi:hypothetical protein
MTNKILHESNIAANVKHKLTTNKPTDLTNHKHKTQTHKLKNIKRKYHATSKHARK